MDTIKITSPMPNENKCPQCGTPLPPNAPAGLCPACLLKVGASETVTDAKQNSFVPPTIAELAAKFPQLEILELIGKGGMGAVYKARQKQLDRIVALKILPPGIGNDMAFAERFTREAKALAKLNHPNIVTLYEFGDADGQFYFLMEFVDGVNLRQLLHAGRISPREALAIVPQICDALQFAHDHGIVHRDIKPENILLDRRGRVKVADFGLAKIIEGRDDTNFSVRENISENLTDAGKTMGTPNYMSPEQKENPGDVDHRADIYALGVVFYQMLTGELPGKKIEPPSRKVQIDVRLDEIVLRALEKNPELRYSQASQFKTQIEAVAEGAAISNFSADFTPNLKDARWKTMIWGFALAMGSIEMATHTTPISYGWSIGIWGLSLWLISTLLALFAGDDLKKIRLACQIVLVDGIGVAAAALWLAWSNSDLPGPWRDTISVVCLGGIVYCLRELFKWTSLKTQSAKVETQLATVKSWLEIIDNGDYARSWDMAAKSFQRAISKDEWIERLGSARRPQGTVFSRKIRFARQYFNLSGSRFIVKFDTAFAGLKAAVETVTFSRERDGQWRAIGYLILPAYAENLFGFSPRVKKFFYVQLPIALAAAFLIHAFFLQAFVVETDAAAPEIPRGSHFLVWKLTHDFAPGDLIAYQKENFANIGRVVRRDENGDYLVNRNGEENFSVTHEKIIGRVVSVYWRGSASETVALKPSSGEPPSCSTSETKISAKSVSLGALLAYAYGPPTTYLHWSENRVMLPPDVADGKFDFELALFDHSREKLQAEIKKQLGLVAYHEMREADVLILTVADASKLSVANENNSSDSRPTRGEFSFVSTPIDDLSDFLEIALGQPVIDETRLTQKYSGHLKWNLQSDKAAELEEIQNALSNQLGLKLVPGHQLVDMLVVEKAEEQKFSADSDSSKKFYIGQTNFPFGDSIEITAVVRTKDRLMAKGHYNLVSHDSAKLALYITTTSNIVVPTDSRQEMQISKGWGNFELVHTHLVPGLAHISMYSTNGRGFAGIYFGNKDEAAEESKMDSSSYTNADLNATQLIQEGWQLWQARKLEEAAAKFRQAIELTPENAEAWNGLGWATFNAGHSSAAEKDFQKVISLEPNHPAALNGLGQIYLSERKYDDAEKYLLQAAPQNASAAWFGLARLYLLEGKFDDAEKWAQKAVNSGTEGNIANELLDAAKQKNLSDDLRQRIEPPPKDSNDSANFGTEMTAAQSWLALTDAGEFSQSWETAGFQQAFTKDAWVKLSEQVREPLGKMISRKIISAQPSTIVTEMPRGAYFTAQFETSFAELTNAVETVQLSQQTNGEWKTIYYLIRPRTTEETAAVTAAQKWLAGIDDGNYAESWTDASEFFRNAITQDKWIAALKSVRTPLGKKEIRTVDSAVTENTLPGAPDGKYIVMQFQTAFADKNSAVETVTFSLEKDGQWRANGYYIK